MKSDMENVAKFVKKEVEITAIFENGHVFLEAGGERFVARPYKHYMHGWAYEVTDKGLAKILGVKPQSINLMHESAEVAAAKIEGYKQKQKEIKLAEIESDFRSMTDTTKMKLAIDSQYLFVSTDSKAGEHIEIKDSITKIKKSRIQIGDILGRNADEVDWGDYSITEYFMITYGEFKKLVAAAEQALSEKAEVDREKKTKREAERQAKFEEARRTGKPVLLRKWSEPCCSKHEECEIDNHCIYAMPDGTEKHEWGHTW